MSDDLIKRLREDQPVTQDMVHTMQCALQDEAADRIEQLERERVDLMTALDKTMSILDTQTQFLFQARTNLESVQAKLAKAVEALRKIKQFQSHSNFILVRFASEALSELKEKEDLKSKEDRLYGDERYTDHGRIED